MDIILETAVCWKNVFSGLEKNNEREKEKKERYGINTIKEVVRLS